MTRKMRQSGQALLAATVGLVALLGATGLAVDMGYLRYQKRLQQSAADSAALAGAAEISFGGSITNAARTDSALNGFTDNGGTIKVTVSHPPTTGPNALKAAYVEVTIAARQPTFFMKIFGINSTTLTARAVAVLGGNGAKGCLYTLGRSGDPSPLGIRTNGGANINAANCGIIDNQNLTKTGNSGAITAASIGVAGNVSNNRGITPSPVTGIVPAADPLLYLTPPPAGGCLPAGTGRVTGGGGSTVVLNPGTYCSGISISGSKNVVLNPGTYVIKGGGVDFGGSGTVNGNGVTLYLGAAGGALVFHGNQTIRLTAPTTGPYAGILLYQNPGNTSDATLDGTNASRLHGAVYFPKADLTINGAAGSTTAYMIVVAKSVLLNGATLSLPVDYSSLPGGSPIKDAVLVE